jgi:excisionase family DNA binding protein
LRGDPLATKPTSNIDVRAYRVDTAAKVYGLSRTTLYKLLAKGRLKSVLIGRRRLILRDSLDALLGLADMHPPLRKLAPGLGPQSKTAPPRQAPGLQGIETQAQAIEALADRAPDSVAQGSPTLARKGRRGKDKPSERPPPPQR